VPSHREHVLVPHLREVVSREGGPGGGREGQGAGREGRGEGRRAHQLGGAQPTAVYYQVRLSLKLLQARQAPALDTETLHTPFHTRAIQRESL
jgi:hypothetical protein